MVIAIEGRRIIKFVEVMPNMHAVVTDLVLSQRIGLQLTSIIRSNSVFSLEKHQRFKGIVNEAHFDLNCKNIAHLKLLVVL